ncbi:MAG: class I SAM-dependent methyltransferase [Micromonosporaceae bacterium]
MADTAPLSTFEGAWAYASTIPGWLKHGQARMLWDAVHRLGAGETANPSAPPATGPTTQPAAAPRIVEIGSHQGRSTVILGVAARQVGAQVTAIDPFVDGRLFGGQETRAKFEKHIAGAGLSDVVDLIPGYSNTLRGDWRQPFDLLYIDGKHDYWTFTDDLRWSTHLPEGGEVLVHDCYSSVGVTLGVLAAVLPGRRYRYVDRSDSLARFQVCHPHRGDRVQLLRQMPWFARNVLIKVLLRLWPGRAVTVLGHTGPHDPY